MASPPIRRLPFPGLEALAADRIARFSKPPPLSGDIETMPSLANCVDAALRRFDAGMRKAAADCQRFQGKPGDWSRNVSAPAIEFPIGRRADIRIWRAANCFALSERGPLAFNR